MSSSASPFRRVSNQPDFPALEQGVLELWDQTNAFQRSIDQRSEEREYTFYDGPPFPTGSPHYGNLLAGILKDVVPRYWTMRGHRIQRRFGWDTHGLPVEMEVQKELEINSPSEIAELGIARFNEACRARVNANTSHWQEVTRRIGRWVDFQKQYRTMDLPFMETVWWVFRQLWDQGLVYRDFKVLPYSFGATTPLSNFEANMDYREVDDPSITVRLAVTKPAAASGSAQRGGAETGDWLLIWTTTPWTLPGNLAVAVGAEVQYVRVRDSAGGANSDANDAAYYWLAEERLEEMWTGDAPEVVARLPGSALVGLEYQPPFGYFAEERGNGAFRTIASDEVTTEEGTGLVHMAPAYGEADFYSLQRAGIQALVDPVDLAGRFTDQVPEVAGELVKEADKTIIQMLKASGALVRRDQIRHSYPFCWRTETPLIYKAIPTWFVRVEQLRERMAELNQGIHWVPEYVGSRRFGNWLLEARDWAISRNRYWGSCIPVWECDACEQQLCIGSVDELAQRSGVRLDDLHKHVVDPVTFACDACDGTMRRVPEVLDCWFESGSMPYAEQHYPFENEETFARRFPADFIAEGLDQTRGWFYTLLVLAAALKDEMPFRNCVVNGMILAEDGRKMSKSKLNYPDPMEVLDEFGGDVLRAYLVNSPTVRAETLRFSKSGLRDTARTVMLPYWNAYSFFTTYAEADGIDVSALQAAPAPAERPEIDRWILSVLQSLIQRVNNEMEGYYLYNVIPTVLAFIDDLTNWYIRRSRRRFWRARRGPEGDRGDADKLAAFATLHATLVTYSRVMAPIVPFIAEEIYQGLMVRPGVSGAVDSVHLDDFPEADVSLIDTELEEAMATVRQVVNLGRALRTDQSLKTRQPLAAVTVATHSDAARAAVAAHEGLIAEELNVHSVAEAEDTEQLVSVRAKADFKALGRRLGKKMQSVANAIAALDEAQVAAVADGGSVRLEDEEISADDLVLVREPREGMAVASEGDITLALECALTDELIAEGYAREVVNRVQAMRRDAGLEVTDRITLRWSSDGERIEQALAQFGEYVAAETLAVEVAEDPSLAADAVGVNDEEVRLALSRA